MKTACPSFITLHSAFCTSLELLFGRPRHQALDSRARGLTFVEDGVHLARDRQLDAAPFGEELDGARRAHALGHLLHPGEHVRERAPAPQLLSAVAVAPKP